MSFTSPIRPLPASSPMSLRDGLGRELTPPEELFGEQPQPEIFERAGMLPTVRAVPRDLMTTSDGLSRYLDQIKRITLLTPEEELELSRKVAATNDRVASDRLVTSHLRLAAKLAMGYRRYGLPMADLVAEANVGLLKAVQKFDPEKGFRLSTYAMWWIKASINEYILNAWSLVKIGTASNQKRVFYNLRKLKSQLGAYEEGTLSEAHAAEIATTLEVSVADVHAMNARLMSRDRSLNAPVGEEGDAERQDFLMDDRPNQEDQLLAWEETSRSQTLVRQGLEVLNERERHIIGQRRLIDDPVTLEALGVHYGLSRERVRQIEARAMEKLEARIRDLVAEERRGIGSSAALWKRSHPSRVAHHA